MNAQPSISILFQLGSRIAFDHIRALDFWEGRLSCAAWAANRARWTFAAGPERIRAVGYGRFEMQQKRNLVSLTGALFVVLTLIAFFAIGGSTPEGDDSAQKVVSFYSDHESKEMIAAVVLALAAVALIFFAATLKQRLDAASSEPGILPTVALGAGIIASGGFATAATVHFALAEYASDIEPSAAQALNALDSDFFLPFVMGLATLILAVSLWLLKNRLLLPTWLGWAGIFIFVISFTPLGFIGFGLAGIWVIVISIMLYLRDETAGVGTPAPAEPRAG
ncbi:MAG TPA: hypothetical protein VH476_01445 [Solirubrobacterales bacterium]